MAILNVLLSFFFLSLIESNVMDAGVEIQPLAGVVTYIMSIDSAITSEAYLCVVYPQLIG